MRSGVFRVLCASDHPHNLIRGRRVAGGSMAFAIACVQHLRAYAIAIALCAWRLVRLLFAGARVRPSLDRTG